MQNGGRVSQRSINFIITTIVQVTALMRECMAILQPFYAQSHPDPDNLPHASRVTIENNANEIDDLMKSLGHKVRILAKRPSSFRNTPLHEVAKSCLDKYVDLDRVMYEGFQFYDFDSGINEQVVAFYDTLISIARHGSTLSISTAQR